MASQAQENLCGFDLLPYPTNWVHFQVTSKEIILKYVSFQYIKSQEMQLEAEINVYVKWKESFVSNWNKNPSEIELNCNCEFKAHQRFDWVLEFQTFEP